MFLTMARKNKVELNPEGVPVLPTDRRLSGADIESVVLSARRLSLTAGRSDMQKGDLEAALADFIPSVQGMEKEMQELAAVIECTQLNLLPSDWRAKVAEPDGRTRLQERLVALRQLLNE